MHTIPARGADPEHLHYDVRYLLKGTARLRDGETVNIPGPNFVKGKVIDKLDTSQLGALLTDFGVIPERGRTKVRERLDDATS